MTTRVRVTMTQSQATSAYGQRLVHQILAISHDGDVTFAEIQALHKTLSEGPGDFACVSFLRTLTTGILHDGAIDEIEMYQLRRAMERVVPKSVREKLTLLLSRIGLPSQDDVDEASPRQRSWRDDPITAKQFAFIRDLGGTPNEGMTKGQASTIIDELLERRAPTPRQHMVLRFFDRVQLMQNTKEEVGAWLDDLYRRDERYELAWYRFKIEIGDDGSVKDPLVVPIGAYRRYMRERRASFWVRVWSWFR